MLIVSGVSFDIFKLAKEYSEDSIELQLLNKMVKSRDEYQYDNLNQLKFELNLRKEIVNASIDLYNSGLSFADFKNAKCNPKYWNRTDDGGFMLNKGTKSSEAINDIYINGHKYATECATAIMIVYYKALLNIYGDKLFSRTFTKIYLFDWVVTEPLLKEITVPKRVTDILLGDRGYFNNPDFNPSTPEWQGENVIILPDSKYYGHGIGIATADTIIRALNSNRKKSAARSAYFLDLVWVPDFKKLSGIYYNLPSRTTPLVWEPFPAPISTSAALHNITE